MLYFFFFFSKRVQILKIVSTFTNVVKLNVKNDNVVEMLSNVVHVNVDSTLLDVVNFNVKIHNLVSTLI